MIDDKSIKDLCEKLCSDKQEAYFNYVFDSFMVNGCVMNVKPYGITEGVKNNMIGTQDQCANVYYSQILVYISQMKALLNLPIDVLLGELIRRLVRDIDKIDGITPVMGFQLKQVQKGYKE